MTILDRIEIVCDDVRNVAADVLILKYAAGLYGADKAVADAIGFYDSDVALGDVTWCPGTGVGADQVAFLGVGPLFDFRYEKIKQFAYDTLVAIDKMTQGRKTISTTIHGPGYGLDEREAFVSQLNGYVLAPPKVLEQIDKILIVELDQTRATRLRKLLADLAKPDRRPPKSSFRTDDYFGNRGSDTFSAEAPLGPPLQPKSPPSDWNWDVDTFRTPVPIAPSSPVSAPQPPPPENAPFGPSTPAQQPALRPREKPKLFVAMPFAEEHQDAYDIAFMDASHDNGFICERLDFENYIGDVTDEIARRIKDAAGIIALLDSSNPNVYYEVGFAMALEKPIIFVAHEDQKIPFDVRNQRRLTYRRIAELRHEMRTLIADLKADGVIG